MGLEAPLLIGVWGLQSSATLFQGQADLGLLPSESWAWQGGDTPQGQVEAAAEAPWPRSLPSDSEGLE